MTYLQNGLIDAYDILQRSNRLLESFTDTMHVRHELQVVVLQYPTSVSVLEERLYQTLPSDYMHTSAQGKGSQ